MIKHMTIKTCPYCNDMLVEGFVMVPNGDKVGKWTCENCKKMFYEKSPYTSFEPINMNNYQKTSPLMATSKSAKKRTKVTRKSTKITDKNT